MNVPHKPLYDFFKRAFDLAVGVLCLTAGLPVYLLIALAIVIDSPGNPLFVQTRVGLRGREFKMVKFRTMYRNSDAEKENLMIYNDCTGFRFKMENDPRVTRVGRFLRKTSLDEAAQALNLLNGTMSVVGPRPFIPSEQAKLPADRLLVKPGLSCYWQIADTTRMTGEEQLGLDYRYIRERGIWTDMKIIAGTVRAVVRGENC